MDKPTVNKHTGRMQNGFDAQSPSCNMSAAHLELQRFAERGELSSVTLRLCRRCRLPLSLYEQTNTSEELTTSKDSTILPACFSSRSAPSNGLWKKADGKIVTSACAALRARSSSKRARSAARDATDRRGLVACVSGLGGRGPAAALLRRPLACCHGHGDAGHSEIGHS